MKFSITVLILTSILCIPDAIQAQLSPDQVITKADEKLRGTTSEGVMKMSIVRPKWTREVVLKSWSKGNDYSLIRINSPARDAGIVFLKRSKEIWNWQPTIERMIKLPPSMMMQSWMGSDFSNDDLVRQSSLITDFNHRFLAEESLENRDCYVVELIPHEDAAVVWGKIIMWISKEDFLQLKSEFYDEEEYLVNTIYGKSVKKFGNTLLPSIMEVIPADDDGNKTIIEYLSLDFDMPIDDNFFSVQNAKRIK